MALRSKYKFSVRGKRPERALSLTDGMRLLKAEKVSENELSLSVNADEKSASALRRRMDTAGLDSEMLSRRGAGVYASKFKRRYVLWTLPLLSLFALFYLSLFVWEISVTGASEVSSVEILRVLEEYGFGVGTFAPEVDTEVLCNQVMSKLPDLSYLAVNIHGCRAEVIVREVIKPPKPITNFEPPKPTYTQFSAAQPLKYTAKRYSGENYTKNAIVFGKFRINLYFSSGNYPATCDIIEERKRLELFGYSFPLGWVQTTVMPWEAETKTLTHESVAAELRTRLSNRVVGGEVINETYSVGQSGGIITVTRSIEYLPAE